MVLESKAISRTLQRMLRRCGKLRNVRRRYGSGQKPGFVNKNIENKGLKALKNNPKMFFKELKNLKPNQD